MSGEKRKIKNNKTGLVEFGIEEGFDSEREVFKVRRVLDGSQIEISHSPNAEWIFVDSHSRKVNLEKADEAVTKKVFIIWIKKEKRIFTRNGKSVAYDKRDEAAKDLSQFSKGEAEIQELTVIQD